MLENEDKSELSIEELGPLSLDELRSLRLFWRAANYLALGQIYLKSNPLLDQALKVTDLKPEFFGNWGTVAGINLVYAHLNRQINRNHSNVLLIAGPGHGCSALIANTFLDGTYSERHPEVTQNSGGLTRLFSNFSHQTFAAGVPEIPGTIQAGYELGHSLSHAYGAVLDASDLVCCCIIGDGEAETGTLSSAWLSHLQLKPATDGVVLPIVHLNGFRTAAPSVLSRLRNEDLESWFKGLGYRPYFVEGSDPERVHQLLAGALDKSFEDIAKIKRAGVVSDELIYPMIILRTPKGWTGPKIIDGQKFEGTAVALKIKQFNPHGNHEHLKILERWFHSYNIRAILDDQGRLPAEQLMWIPKEHLRLGARAEANGGNRQDLNLPPVQIYCTEAATKHEDGTVVSALGKYLREVIRLNHNNFRLFSSDGTNSGEYLKPIFEVTNRALDEEIEHEEAQFTPGRVIEILSQQTCSGLLEGYVLTGRHGIYICAEQFSNIILSMQCQFAHWLGTSKKVGWRRSLPAVNYLLLSRLWSNDSNDPVHHPGFIAAALNQVDNVTTVWLPPDLSCAVVVMEACLVSVDSINIIVANVHCQERWLDCPTAIEHCRNGISIWHWAGNTDELSRPDLILACAGMVATRETIKAARRLTSSCPDLKIRVVNVLNLNKLRDKSIHPDGLSTDECARFFPPDTPVLLAYDGFCSEICSLIGTKAGHWSMYGYGEKSYPENGSSSDGVSFPDLTRLAVSKIDKPIEGLDRLKQELQHSL